MRICLVSPGHLSTNPRLMKEARALRAAGHEIVVICGRYSAWGIEEDLPLASELGRVISVPFGPVAASRLTYIRQTLVRRLAVLMIRMGCSQGWLAEPAHHPASRELARAAATERADLYIAHYVAALPAAAHAARRNGARYAFDAEDYHLGDLPDEPVHAQAKSLIRAIESRYLPSAAYVTAASPMIANAYAETYGIAEPTTVLNLFPRGNGPEAPSSAGSHRPGPTLYWFSQVIGPGRGLETALRAIALTQAPVQLHLRGTPARGYAERLRGLAAELGVADRLHLLDPIAPNELERDGARFDMGYAGDLAETRNRKIALTNKLFSYLTSGLPILASDIPAHRGLAGELGEAVVIFPLGDPAALAAAIDRFCDDPHQLSAARRHAWQLGQGQFAWEGEQGKLVSLVDACAAA